MPAYTMINRHSGEAEAVIVVTEEDADATVERIAAHHYPECRVSICDPWDVIEYDADLRQVYHDVPGVVPDYPHVEPHTRATALLNGDEL